VLSVFGNISISQSPSFLTYTHQINLYFFISTTNTLLDDFAVDLMTTSQWTQYCKRGVWLAALECFSPLSTHLARPERIFFLYPSRKKELAG
jgi:hypothetical protein